MDFHLPLVLGLGVETIADAVGLAASATRALPCLRLGYLVHLERLEVARGRVELTLDHARVDDVLDATDGDRGLGDVRGHDHFALASNRTLSGGGKIKGFSCRLYLCRLYMQLKKF